MTTQTYHEYRIDRKADEIKEDFLTRVVNEVRTFDFSAKKMTLWIDDSFEVAVIGFWQS